MKEANVVLFGAYIILLIAACLLSWAAIIYSSLMKRPIAPIPTPRPLAPWGLFDLGVGFLFVFLAATLFARVWIGFGLPTRETDTVTTATKTSVEASHKNDEAQNKTEVVEPEVEKSKANPSVKRTTNSTNEPHYTMPFQSWLMTSQLLAMVITTLWVCKRCQVGPGRVGWRTEKFSKQMILGVAFVVLFVPPIYIIMAVVTKLTDKAYSHPLIDMIGNDPTMLAFAIWSAVVVAPITEEFAFRVMLQGFLESIAAGGVGIADVVLGRQSFWPMLSLSHQVSVPPVDNAVMLEDPHMQFAEPPVLDSSTIQTNPYSSPSDVEPMQHALAARSIANDAPVNVAALPWWPVVVSGTLFGLAHYDYGVSWLPLIILGIALGWLYRITGTIWPSLVVHVIVNATSMWGLASQMMMDGK